ncbi:S1 family peptidase [Lentzea tibetensis]|uniref:S1 family peptidase n=1 Tax=Lentzea tibetensis TaxID=2591470 RepID=A0A563F0C7_9PSEU|nr:S1 family peptidase [Lentzea tibetensis]TWP53343.1 S1 family peptidase [Lentzea tibetensis]
MLRKIPVLALLLCAAVATPAQSATTLPDSVASWWTEGDTLVVSVTSRDAAATRFLATLPGKVRVVQEPKLLMATDVKGGDGWNNGTSRCSVGFSATGSGGSKHFITAGHCTKVKGATARSTTTLTTMGTVNGSTFSKTGDFGKVDVTSAEFALTPKVNGYGTGDVTIKGSTEAAIGASVCKSGSTTKVTCGKITAKNVSFNAGNGVIVEGLTKTDICSNPGDSGGAVYAGAQAQGIVSAGTANCTSGKLTLFQPIGEALSAFGVTLVRG